MTEVELAQVRETARKIRLVDLFFDGALSWSEMQKKAKEPIEVTKP